MFLNNKPDQQIYYYVSYSLLQHNKTKVKSVLSGGATAGKITIQIELFLSAVRASGFARLSVADGVSVPFFTELLHVHNGHLQLWQDLLFG
jgi:hypothetical protein